MIRSNYTTEKTYFFNSIQKYFEFFIFFSVFPLIKVFGISITFFIFLFIAYRFKKNGLKIYKFTSYWDLILVLFLFFLLIAALVPEETYRDRSIVSYFKIPIQYIYWVIVALFVKTWIYQFDFMRISRAFFFGLMTALFYMELFNGFYKLYPPNAFAYVTVSTYPIAAYYMKHRFSRVGFIGLSFPIIFSVLLVGSRTGMILILLEFILLLIFGSAKSKKFSLILLGFLTPIILFYGININFENYKYEMADKIEPFSPKIARGIRLSEKLKEIDKSLLTRELMIEKGKKIFEKHPFFGVGPGNFTYYGADISPRSVSKHLHRTVWSYNKTSPQNSFLMILSESGIFATLSLAFIYLAVLIKGMKYMVSFQDNVKLNIYISFIGIMLYSVILVTTMGTLAWLLLGLSLTILSKKRISP